LIILIVPVCLCLMHFALRYERSGDLTDLLGATGTLLCLLLAGRSVLSPALLWITNKYPVVLLVEILTGIAVIQETGSVAQAQAAISRPHLWSGGLGAGSL
jgi:hypothetical protein